MSDINTAYDTLVESQQKEILQLKKEMAELKEKYATKPYTLPNGIVIQATQSEINICEKYENKLDSQFEMDIMDESKELQYMREYERMYMDALGVDDPDGVEPEITKLKEEVDILIKGVTGTVEGDEILDILKRHLDPEYVQALIDSDDHDPLGIYS